MKKLASTIVLLSALSAGSANAAELITNGSFENGLTGWSCTGADMCQSNAIGAHTGSFGAYGYDNTGMATLSQTISTVIGNSYDYSFFSSASQTSGNTLLFNFSGAISNTLVPTTTTWRKTTGNFVATSNSTNIALYFQTTSGSGVWKIDDVSVMAAVPEPETYALMLAGLGLIGGVARRRNNKTANA